MTERRVGFAWLLIAVSVIILGLWFGTYQPDRAYLDADPVEQQVSAVTTGATVVPPTTNGGTSPAAVPVAPVGLSADVAVQRLGTIPGDTLPVPPEPIRWGANGSSIPGRCTQWEPLIADLAPPAGWDVPRMSGFAWRETKCCPQVRTDDGWRTTQGGDRFDGDCNLTHVAAWHHRSDAGLLQVNGINYDPARCKNTCLSDWLATEVTVATLGDPWLNVRAAARLCEFWVDAGESCYQPWL